MNRSPSAPSPPAAVTAFLRGVDRRGRLLALVQTGDSGAAQTALIVAAKVFASEAGQWPIAQWPMQYWRLLLSVPAMGQRRSDGDRSDVLPEIARLMPSQRAAVLLHLAAGLEDADAATALGLGVEDYQQRIRSALPRDAQGELDLAIWRGWRDATQQALEQLPEAGEAASPPIEQNRSEPRSEPAATANRTVDVAATKPPRRRAAWRALFVLLLIAGMAAGLWLHPRGRALLDVWRGRIHAEALPAAAPPKARFDPNDAALDPDRALHADPVDLALAHRLPLLSWLAASGEPLPAAPMNGTTAPPAASTPILESPTQRSDERGAWAEWQALTETERNTLRETASRFDALPDPQRNALTARYASQSFDAQRGWHLGPTLGPSWPKVAPLFAFDEPSQRDALLALLRHATPEDIDTLSRLAQSTPPQDRAGLRKQLLALPSSQRSAWLKDRLLR
ncbi:MAG: hypothetical protein IT472_07130 [Thermomonas sp.]|uniref:hypothetical protein n=1 Tax=Thermomonas sp. TaxID=1971895 RepID=UPI00262047A7|nr:hypothetical protein [Thermomonas sp.]MCC7096932.1 hypothetical protein [Thermomonas sp.]